MKGSKSSSFNNKKSSRVEDILNILGVNKTLLLSWPLGTKGDKRRWGHLTTEAMRDPAYVSKLEIGNIGVALGERSGALCAVDLDRDELRKPFLELNDWAQKTTEVRGARGCKFLVRIRGKYPGTMHLKRGKDDEAQWLADGAQAIVSGKHPDGMGYVFVNSAQPLEIEYHSIVWPKGLAFPSANRDLFENKQCTEGTDETDETDATEGTKDTQEIVGVGCVCCKVQNIDDALALSLPTSAHANHNHLFTLARALKTLELNCGKPYTPNERREIFNQWHDRAQPYLRPSQSKEEYMIEFLNSYKSAKYPIGTGDIEAWQWALKNSLPADFLPHFEKQEIRLVIGFCIALQRNAGSSPFFLSCRTVQKFLNNANHTTAASWLRALVVDDVLVEIEKGNRTGRASRYRLNQWPQRESIP
jgi:hypothetical protein